MSLLQVKDLCAWYGPTQALFNVNFELAEGGITTILGANGAGKTTTLRGVCQTVKTSGEMIFDGKSTSGLSTDKIVRMGVAHVPDVATSAIASAAAIRCINQAGHGRRAVL